MQLRHRMNTDFFILLCTQTFGNGIKNDLVKLVSWAACETDCCISSDAHWTVSVAVVAGSGIVGGASLCDSVHGSAPCW